VPSTFKHEADDPIDASTFKHGADDPIDVERDKEEIPIDNNH
jgi:hypothetical protein